MSAAHEGTRHDGSRPTTAAMQPSDVPLDLRVARSKEAVISMLNLCSVINTINVLIYIFGSYRHIHRKGAAYDVAFGVETSLNLISDVAMIRVLQQEALPLTSNESVERVLGSLGLFLFWNSATTLFCYVGHIAASNFASKYEHIEHLEPGEDEDAYRRATFIHGVVMYTLIAVVKVLVLCAIYAFFADCLEQVEQTRQGGVQRAVFVAHADGPDSVVIIVTQGADRVGAVPAASSVSVHSVGNTGTKVPLVSPISAVTAMQGVGRAVVIAPVRPPHSTAGSTATLRASVREPQGQLSVESSQWGSRTSRLTIPDVEFPALRPHSSGSMNATPGPSRPRRRSL